MNKKPCIHETLGANESGRVQICRDCNVVHLQMQNMSLRFEPQQFAQLASLVTEASRKMAGKPEDIAHKLPKFVIVH